jgi:hypothetical protein
MPNTQTIECEHYVPRVWYKQPRKRLDAYSPCHHKRLFVQSLKGTAHKLPLDPLARYGFVKHSQYRVSRQRAKARESLEREFKSLAQRWRNETTHLSIASEKANNFAYQQIVGMGEKVLPLIFRELETTTSDWFWALRAIAREKAPVIPAEDRGRVRRIAEIWMDWGKQNGYVSG